MTDFNPPLLLKNHHLQTIFASTGPRRILLQQKAKAFINNSTLHILDCGNDIRLQGMYTGSPEHKKGLVILLHGWLGHYNSLYLLSAGNALFKAGYNIFRLNLRDHGDSAHLNKKLFHSVRLQEVVNASKQIQQQFPHDHNYLAGFSLGGNFSLRIALQAPKNHLQLKQVVAICPVIDPSRCNTNLHSGLFIYHNYFRNKWKRSLRKKLDFYPEHGYGSILSGLSTLNAMNDYFVPNHTGFASVEDYLNGYAISSKQLTELKVPCHIISSQDDPVICAEDIKRLTAHPKLTIEITQYGGHCGYLENYSLNSWIDRRLLTLFTNHSPDNS